MITLTVKRLREVLNLLKRVHVLLLHTKVPLPVEIKETVSQNQSTITRVKKLIDFELEESK